MGSESSERRTAQFRTAPEIRHSSQQAFGCTLWVRVHRYIGLVLGALFVLVGLTGSILAFWQAIDEWLNADIMRVEVPLQATYRPLDEILAAARAIAPPNGVPESLTLPRHPRAAASIFYVVPGAGEEPDYYEVFADPYTAKATGQRLMMRGGNLLTQPFIHIVMDLHWTLLAGYDKSYLVGIPAIFLLASVLVGLYLWWPRNGNWRQALTVKWGATPVRLTYDIHKTFGLYLSAVLIVILFSGIYIIFKPEVSSIVRLFSPVREEPKDVKSTLVLGQAPLGLEAAAAIANKVFPDGKLKSISLPKGPAGVYVVGKQSDDEPNRAATYRHVTIDQYSGQILHIQDRANFTPGEIFLEWQYPLHCGEAFGNYGRAFIMLMGFVPLILYVTGFMRWRQKRRARKCSKAHRRVAATILPAETAE